MNIYFRTFIIACALSFSFFNCTIRYYDANKLLNDYKTEGFLDRDHYQVIIHGKPDKKARGLSLQRQSALNDAKDKMKGEALNSLSEFSLNGQIKKENINNVNDILNITEAREELALELEEYYRSGYIAFEYYNMDNSAVLVYRIFKEDLIDIIKSINCGLKVKEKIKGEKK